MSADLEAVAREGRPDEMELDEMRECIERQNSEITDLRGELAAVKAERDRLLEALAQSGATKADLYRFHWKSGTPSEGMGATAEDAFTRLGYGAGAVAALDYYELVTPHAPDEVKEASERR